LNFSKTACIFQGKQPYLSNVVEFQSSNLKILARTNTIALKTTLNRMKLRDSSVYEACPCNATESLYHFLLERPAYTNMRSMFSRNCWLYACLSALSGFHRVVAFTKTTIFDWWHSYYFNQVCGDFFDMIGKSMLKRMYAYRSSVLNIDWNVFLLYYLLSIFIFKDNL
jgi:hypothetical protein